MSKEYLEALDRILHCNDDDYTLGYYNHDTELVKQALHRLESIDNANPSEALETLKDMLIGNGVNDNINDYVDNLILPIKSALLKVQEPKKNYLKWEDLEFGVPTSLPITMKVKMGNTQYLLSLRTSFFDVKSVVLSDNNLKPILHLFEKEKQIFNDLHLERAEEND